MRLEATECPNFEFSVYPLPYRDPDSIFRDRVERATRLANYGRGVSLEDLAERCGCDQKRIAGAVEELRRQDRLGMEGDQIRPGAASQWESPVPKYWQRLNHIWEIEFEAMFEAVYARVHQLWGEWEMFWSGRLHHINIAGFNPGDIEELAVKAGNAEEFNRLLQSSLATIEQLILSLNDSKRESVF